MHCAENNGYDVIWITLTLTRAYEKSTVLDDPVR